MAHRIFTGEFAALEARLCSEIAGVQNDDPLTPVPVLVGSNLLASYLKYRIVDQGRAAANLRFHTFLDLARRLAGTAFRDEKPLLPPMAPSYILDRILQESTPAAFEGISELRGFRRALLDTFRDLRDAGVAPDELEVAVRRISLRAPDRRDQLLSFENLFRRFRQKTALFQDVDVDFELAIRGAAGAESILESGTLWIYGIYDVTGRQAELLDSLRDVVELTYFIPFVDELSSGFAKSFLESRVAELGVAFEALSVPSEGKSLRLLSSRIFAGTGSAEPLAPDGSFKLVSVPGESRAAVEVVREILRSAHDRLITGFHEIAVLLRHPADEAPVLLEAFRLRKIPYYLHGGTAFDQRPLCRAVLAIASLEADSFSRRAVQRALELIEAALPPEVSGEWDAVRWRGLARDLGIVSGVEAWDRGMEALVNNLRRDLRSAENDARASDEEETKGGTVSVSRARQHLEAAEKLRFLWKRLKAAAADWPAGLTWGKWSDFLEGRLKPLLGKAGDWDAFAIVLEEMRSLGDVAEIGGFLKEVDRAELTASMEELLADLSFPAGDFQRSGVNILSMTDARGLRFPVVIVPGLDEGKFPARLRQDPLLLDEERRTIGDPPRLSLKSLRFDEEKLLYSTAARSAAKRLVLLTSRLDEASDRERIPSDFFLRSVAAARGSPIRLRDLTEDRVPGFRSVSLERPASDTDPVPVDEGEVRLRLIAGSASPGRALKAVAEEEPFRLDGPMAFVDARWKRVLTGFDGRLQDPALVRQVAESFGPAAGRVSPSRLEVYARCPYRFFLSRVIGLEAWEDPEPVLGLNPKERGLILHSALESFLREISWEDFCNAPSDAAHARLRSFAAEFLKARKPEGIPDLLWEIERDGLLELLSNWCAHERSRTDSGLRPVWLEQSFGDNACDGAPAPLTVQAGRHTFQFGGKIDRVDFSPDRRRARVIDYKIGRLPQTMEGKKGSPLMGGERMQIVIYGAAVSALHPEAAVEAEYLHLQPRDLRIRPRSFNPAELRDGRERLPQLLEIIGDGIEQGVFFDRATGSVYPDSGCGYCEFVPVCGKDRQQRQDWKASDPAVRRFSSMLDAEPGPEDEE